MKRNNQKMSDYLNQIPNQCKVLLNPLSFSSLRENGLKGDRKPATNTKPADSSSFLHDSCYVGMCISGTNDLDWSWDDDWSRHRFA